MWFFERVKVPRGLSILAERNACAKPLMFLASPLVAEVRRLLLAHLDEHYALYGEYTGVRTARKHIAWYLRSLPGGEAFRDHMNSLEDSASQQRAVAHFLDDLAERHERLPQVEADTLPLLESIA